MQLGIADDQNFARLIQRGRGKEITFENAETLSSALRNRPYPETYRELARGRSYNLKLPDGALIQLTYAYESKKLERHRLAFLPSPFLEKFQNHPEIYLEEEIYADVVARSIVPSPIRFDYDERAEIHKELSHPRSHLTIGQYKNCRIPVSAPITPLVFIDFILRNFYHTAHETWADELPKSQSRFSPTISQVEQEVVHVALPV